MYFCNIFPTTIGIFSLERELNELEKQCVINLEKRFNCGNLCSVDSYILKNDALRQLNTFFTESVNAYFLEVYKPKYQVQPYITQSWANYTSKNQWHHKHTHPNSFISGVFYFSADVVLDRIQFYKNDYQPLSVAPIEITPSNLECFELPVETGVLLLFPSSLAHRVNTVQHENTRISLSFNTFLKGQLGEEHVFSQLIL
jgi:uncharacterized protein (TIGR02466 family)